MILNSPHFSVFNKKISFIVGDLSFSKGFSTSWRFILFIYVYNFLELAYKVKARPHLNQAKSERSMLLNVHFLSSWFSWLMVSSLSISHLLIVEIFFLNGNFYLFWGGYVTFRWVEITMVCFHWEVNCSMWGKPPLNSSLRIKKLGT